MASWKLAPREIGHGRIGLGAEREDHPCPFVSPLYLVSMNVTSTNASASLIQFAPSLTSETAFDVLAVAKRLKARGKDVIELQIGDSPFPTTSNARAAGIRAIARPGT